MKLGKMEVEYQSLLIRVPVAFVSIIYGALMFFNLLWRFVKSPLTCFQSEPKGYLPDCANSPSLGEHNYINVRTSTGDLVFHYVANGDKSKPLMLLLHGFPECWYSWRYQLKAFGSKYWVVAVDMRGYAGSDKPSGIENYRGDVLRDDVCCIVKALGYEKCVLVAHDWGGAVAWNVANTNPEIIDELVIMNAPYSSVMRKRMSGSFKQFLASWYIFWFQNPYFPEIFLSMFNFGVLASFYKGRRHGLRNRENMTDEDVEVFKYYYHSWEAREAPINYYRAIFRYKQQIRKEKIKVRTLLIWGEEDAALTIQLAQDSADMCEDCTISYVKEASHWVQQDCPDQVNKCMDEFLS